MKARALRNTLPHTSIRIRRAPFAHLDRPQRRQVGKLGWTKQVACWLSRGDCLLCCSRTVFDVRTSQITGPKIFFRFFLCRLDGSCFSDASPISCICMQVSTTTNVVPVRDLFCIWYTTINTRSLTYVPVVLAGRWPVHSEAESVLGGVRSLHVRLPPRTVANSTFHVRYTQRRPYSGHLP